MFVNKIYIVIVLVFSHLISQIPDAIGRNGAVSSSNKKNIPHRNMTPTGGALKIFIFQKTFTSSNRKVTIR